MLSYDKYSQIVKQGLLKYLEKSGSAGQEKKRISEMISKAIMQVNGISDKCPEDLLEELIPAELILVVVQSLLRIGTNRRKDNENKVLNSRIADLAAGLVELGMMACMEQHHLLFKDTKHLGEPILTQMQNAVATCKDLAYQVELVEQDRSAYENKLLYLFKWKKISQRGKERLARYLYERTEIPLGEIKIQKMDGRIIIFNVVDELFPLKGRIRMQGKKSAILKLSNGTDFVDRNIVYTDKLVIKEGIDSKYVFGKPIA